jgi:hypothetical protein
VIEYLQTENHVLCAQLEPGQLRFADDRRVRLTAKANITPTGAPETGAVVSPETLLAWHRHLICTEIRMAICGAAKAGHLEPRPAHSRLRRLPRTRGVKSRHQGLGNELIPPNTTSIGTGPVADCARLCGVLKSYYREAG